jgi:hypothetical protein
MLILRLLCDIYLDAHEIRGSLHLIRPSGLSTLAIGKCDHIRAADGEIVSGKLKEPGVPVHAE